MVHSTRWKYHTSPPLKTYDDDCKTYKFPSIFNGEERQSFEVSHHQHSSQLPPQLWYGSPPITVHPALRTYRQSNESMPLSLQLKSCYVMLHIIPCRWRPSLKLAISSLSSSMCRIQSWNWQIQVVAMVKESQNCLPEFGDSMTFFYTSNSFQVPPTFDSTQLSAELGIDHQKVTWVATSIRSCNLMKN